MSGTARSAAPAQLAPPLEVPGDPRVWLAIILCIAAALRIVGLTSAPPGLNQDEALSAWNGWCLLRTGHALSGEAWPIFHCRNIGDFPTMLFFYVLMPFQAVGGLSVWTTRLPVALAGVFAVLSVWHLARALYGTRAACFAALALAVAPWSVFLGHFGTGSSLGPLQALLPLSALLAARVLPGARSPGQHVRPGWALVAGLLFGIGTYGFHSLRLQLPLTLAGVVALFPGHWRLLAADRAGRRAITLLALGFVVTFAPMAWVSATDPDSLRRWEMTRLWPAGASLLNIAQRVTERWLVHFQPDFLFQRGDRYPVLNPAGAGALAWWMLPGLLAGTVVLVLRALRHAPARLALLLLVLYPVGDLVSANNGVHSLRSAAGLPALALVIACGFTTLMGWRWLRARRPAALFVTLLAIAVAVETAGFSQRFFIRAPRDPELQLAYQSALLEAGQRLGGLVSPNLPVYCTTTGMNEPFAILLTAANYPPERWLTDPKDILPGPFERYRSFGRFHFMYDDVAARELTALESNGRADSVVFLVRPREFGLANPIATLRDAGGREVLWICVPTL